MNIDMNKHFTDMTYKELYKRDIRKVKKFLLDNQELLNYDEEYAGWFINDEPLSYYLFFENLLLIAVYDTILMIII